MRNFSKKATVLVGIPTFLFFTHSKSIELRKPFILFAMLIGTLGFGSTAHADYPLARVTNNTPYTVSGEVQYVSAFCKDDSYTVAPGATWTASSRGVCLIDDITGTMSGAVGEYGESTKITPYNASPATSYSGFQINAYSGSYRIFSEDEWNDVSDTKHGKSPGFYFVNKTAWPLTYSLDQVGCLHHGIIPTGQGEGGVLKVDTGAVWFTMKIAIQPDGVDPVSNWDCVKPVAELVGDVAMAAVTGGGTAVAKAGGKVVVKQVVKAVVKEGVKTAVKKAAKKVIKDLAKDELGKLLTGAGSVELYGQYAGYEWPFRCDKMPEYHIIGGPQALRDETGELYLERGVPFKVMKVNDCGDDMMLGSKRSMESDQSSFSDWPGGGANSTVESGDPSCVTFYTGTNGGGSSLQLCGAANNWKEYINLGNPGTSDFHHKVKSLKCNSGINSVQFIDGNAPSRVYHNHSCKGGNLVNVVAWVSTNATGVGVYDGYCCGEEPKPLTAAQKAEVEAARQRAEQARKEEEFRRRSETHETQQAEIRRNEEIRLASRTPEEIAANEAIELAAKLAREESYLEIRRSNLSGTLQMNCSKRGSVMSIENPSEVATPFTVLNLSEYGMHLYWIDTNGQEVNYASEDKPIALVYPGLEGHTDSGKPGYWYVAYDNEGHCVGLATLGEHGNELSFDPRKIRPDVFEKRERPSYSDPEPTPAVSTGNVVETQAATAVAAGPGCEYMGQVKSTDEGGIVDVRFENHTSNPLHVYWINGSGEASNYAEDGGTVASIPAQSFQVVRTKIGHVFLGNDPNGTCLGMAVAETDGETIAYAPLQ